MDNGDSVVPSMEQTTNGTTENDAYTTRWALIKGLKIKWLRLQLKHIYL